MAEATTPPPIWVEDAMVEPGFNLSWFNCSGDPASTHANMHENVIGVGIALGANTIIPIGIILQKYAIGRAQGARACNGRPTAP